jgi:hypothetical protein
MARTKRKPTVTIRRVKTKEDRKRPSVFMRLKQDEYFRGVALFEPDPEIEDNNFYYEYYDHYDKQGNSYVPCAGDKCPFCAINDNPATRALTVWYFPQNDAGDQIKVFTMNFSTTTDISDEAEEEGGLMGKTVRIKRMDDRGDYKVRVLNDKPLTKVELKKALALAEEKFGEDGLEGLVMKQLQAQMERLKALDALEDDDDDDDDEETPSRARKGKVKAAPKDEDDEEDEDDDEEEDDEDEEEDEDEDEDAEDDEEEDDEDEEDEDDDEDEEETDDEEEDAQVISRQDFTVVKFQENDEILDVTDGDGTKQKMWVGEGVDTDADTLKKGVTVTLDAEQDDEGDWIITALTVKKKAATRRKPATRTTRSKK